MKYGTASSNSYTKPYVSNFVILIGHINSDLTQFFDY